jgi:uncharacterized protein
MKTFEAATTGALIIALGRGDDIYDGILAACRAHDVRDAAIVSGVGVLAPVVLHDVTTEGYPIGENVRTLAGPWELTSISGLVIDGEVHAHIGVSNSETSEGGHLHPGTTVLYLAELVLVGLQTSPPGLRREHETGTNLWLIGEKSAVPPLLPIPISPPTSNSTSPTSGEHRE